MNGIEKYLKGCSRNEEGVALITVLLVLIILTTLAMGYMLTSTSQQMISRNRIDDNITFLAADAGIAYAITNLTQDATWEKQHLRNDFNPATGGYWMREDGFERRPDEVWDEETIPLPDGSYAYARTWVEYASPTASVCPTGLCYDSYVVSLASYQRAVKIVEAQFYFPMEIFNFAYYGRKAIHLDNHGVPAKISVASTAWTNGEFEMDGGMVMRAATDEFISAGGHVQVGGNIYGTIYAPSVDTYGPDGEGFNTSSDCNITGTCWGTIYGNVYLLDGYFRNAYYSPGVASEPRFLFRDPNSSNPRTLIDPEEIALCPDGGDPYTTLTCPGNAHIFPNAYDIYAAVASTDVGLKPGEGCTEITDFPNAYFRPGIQNCVVTCSEDPPPSGKSCSNVQDDPGTPDPEGYVLSYSGFGPHKDPLSPFDPNKRPRYAYRLPNRGGRVLLYRDFPDVDWQALYDKAKADKTILPAKEFNRTHYITGNRASCIWGLDATWMDPTDCDPGNTYTFNDNIGGTQYKIIGRKNVSGEYEPTIWYIGDGPLYDPNDELILSSVRDLESDPNIDVADTVLWRTRNNAPYINLGVIVNGCIAVEGRIRNPLDAGSHIYGCGRYDFYSTGNSTYEAGTDKIGHDPSQWTSVPDDPPDTGDFPFNINSWFNFYNFYPNSTTAGDNTIPYSLPAFIVGSNNDQDGNPAIFFNTRDAGTGATQFMFIHGAIFTYGQCNIEASQDQIDSPGPPVTYLKRSINGSYFLYGSQVANIIHNNRFLAFEYDDCVKEATAGYFGSQNRDLVEVINWRTLPEIQGVITSH